MLIPLLEVYLLILVSCSLLTYWLCSFNCLSYGDVIYGTSYLYSLGCLSYGDVVCGISTIYLVTYTTINIVYTIIGIVDGSTLPLIILCALTFVFSCSLFILELEVFSSTLFFLLRTLLRKYVLAFFLFSNVFYISSLI